MPSPIPSRTPSLATAAILLLATAPARATDFFISTTGSDTNPGTLASPYASFSKALTAMSPGDTLYVRAGTYNLTSRIRLTKSGTASLPMSIATYPGDAAPILDFTNNTSTTDRGIQLDASFWNISNLTVQHAPDNGVLITGSNNNLRQIITRYNKDSGLQIAAGSIGAPSNNFIVNCDSYENYDPAAHGENADGFVAKFRGIGPGNVFRGVRAWGNSDDGFDFWGAENGVRVENSWSFKNGKNIWADTAFAGDGNGMKLGHDSGTHIITGNLVWGNLANGIDVNGNATAPEYPETPIAHGVQIYNNTVFSNGYTFSGRNIQFDEPYPHILKDNISLLGNKTDIVNGASVVASNSWNGTSLAATLADFLSTDDSGATAPRPPSGDLPDLAFLHLSPTSHLIDAGSPIPGYGYQGRAPELGAYEYFPLIPEPSNLSCTFALLPLTAKRRR